MPRSGRGIFGDTREKKVHGGVTKDPSSRFALLRMTPERAATSRTILSLGRQDRYNLPMRVGLVRHGEAEAGGSDDRRALTRGGREGAERVALAAAGAGVRVERIRHSGKARALETAEIFARRLGCPVDPDPLEELLPGASPQETARWIESLREPHLLVSHLPLVERLAALLVSGSHDDAPLPFPPATLLWLEADGGLWRTLAHITPQSLGRL